MYSIRLAIATNSEKELIENQSVNLWQVNGGIIIGKHTLYS